MDVWLALGIIGMVLILVAFLLNQMNVWKKEMLVYDACNALGALLLIVYAYSGRAWPFVILNAVWLIYSLRDVLADVRRT